MPRKNSGLNAVCEKCGKAFHGRKGARFCGYECFNESRKRRTVCTCSNCGKSIEKPNSQINWKNHFCSDKCYHEWQAASEKGGWNIEQRELNSARMKDRLGRCNKDNYERFLGNQRPSFFAPVSPRIAPCRPQNMGRVNLPLPPQVPLFFLKEKTRTERHRVARVHPRKEEAADGPLWSRQPPRRYSVHHTTRNPCRSRYESAWASCVKMRDFFFCRSRPMITVSPIPFNTN